MPDIFLYLIKVVACSGILCGYYRIALFNRNFHQWNRLYLLFSVVISLVIPCMRLPVLPASPIVGTQPQMPTGAATPVTGFFHETPAEGPVHLSATAMAETIYVLVALLVLVRLLAALWRLRSVASRSAVSKIDGCYIAMTTDKSAPFSFFRLIFWNPSIDRESATGRRMFDHELVHVREVHSADKLFMSLVLIPFWCNPFFWLIRKELNVVHEFIADDQTVGPGGKAELSRMILASAYPSGHFTITSNFYSSSIKRRLHMLNKSIRRRNYAGLLLALPVLLTLLAAFTFTHKRSAASHMAMKPLTIVIDAGHGGEDNGALAADGTREKDLTLALAKKVQAANTNPNIHILLTRSEDMRQDLRDKIDFSLKANPDAFISIHVNADNNGARGVELYSSSRNIAHSQQVSALQSLVSQHLKAVYPSSIVAKQSVSKVYVLDASTVNYPAMLIEFGNLLNGEDLAFIRDPQHQQEIATQIVQALGDFGAAR